MNPHPPQRTRLELAQWSAPSDDGTHAGRAVMYARLAPTRAPRVVSLLQFGIQAQSAQGTCTDRMCEFQSIRRLGSGQGFWWVFPAR